MNASDQTRLELLAVLAELGRIRPEWRLGQLIANLAMTAGRLDSGGVWDLEDGEALAAAKTLIEQYSEVDPEPTEADDPDERKYPEPKQRDVTDHEKSQLRARIEAGDADIYALATEFGCSASQVAGIKAAMHR